MVGSSAASADQYHDHLLDSREDLIRPLCTRAALSTMHSLLTPPDDGGLWCLARVLQQIDVEVRRGCILAPAATLPRLPQSGRQVLSGPRPSGSRQAHCRFPLLVFATFAACTRLHFRLLAAVLSRRHCIAEHRPQWPSMAYIPLLAYDFDGGAMPLKVFTDDAHRHGIGDVGSVWPALTSAGALYAVKVVDPHTSATNEARRLSWTDDKKLQDRHSDAFGTPTTNLASLVVGLIRHSSVLPSLNEATCRIASTSSCHSEAEVYACALLPYPIS